MPGHEPYDQLTVIDVVAAGDRTELVMTLDPLHDEAWTQQHRAHRGEELDNLAAAIRRRAPQRRPTGEQAPGGGSAG